MSASRDHVVLVGMMGAGKSTVGPLLAERMGRPYLDSDAEVERATGMAVPEIFAVRGEAEFRGMESRALRVLLSSERSAVLAVAGGAVLDPANRDLLARSGTVVWLRAAVRTLVGRLGSGDGRALVQPDPSLAVPALVAERYPLYEALASCAVEVDDRTPEEVVELVRAAVVRSVRVELGSRSYEVRVGPGARRDLASLVPASARRAAIVTQPGVDVAVEPGIDTVRLEIPGGEKAKSMATVERLCRELSLAGITRRDVVVAVGGGVVTDTAGFAAACYHRGVDVIHVSTTLLGQVDAAIGGKTGVNLPEGKNLVGAFWQPRAVICDTDVLATLHDREWRSGLGEMAKYAFLGLDDLDRLPLAEQVARCVALKAEVVAGDERESGRRAVLNYGHTLAHALEAAGFASDGGEPAPGHPGGSPRGGARGPMRHGEAVAVGLVFAARLARRLGRIADERVDRHLEVVRSYGLATELPEGADAEELVTLMARDKKATDGLSFVLDGPAGVELVHGVRRDVVLAALADGPRGDRR